MRRKFELPEVYSNSVLEYIYLGNVLKYSFSIPIFYLSSIY